MNNKINLKKFAMAFFLLIYSFFGKEIKAQCGTGMSVVLTTQTDVNNFISTYCTNFLGFLTILDNNDGVDNITDLTPLATLTVVGERLLIRNNASLSSLDGLGALSEVNGVTGMFLLGNTALTDISGLSSLTTVGGPLTIQGNNMASFTGLDNLSSIAGNFSITDNDLLTDMTNLTNLTSIDGYLTINNNDLLASLSGIDNIDPTTIVSAIPAIDDLNIHDNPLLEECEVTSICDAFDIPTLTTNIMNNATGCAGNLEIVTACAALPVEWLNDLIARAKGNSIELSFATVQETNNSYFEIEKSQDGRSYQTIGIIEGKGTSSIESYYNYLDKNPSIGKNYYRVKQVDFDGKYEYSNIASAQFENDKINIYPNPAIDELIIMTNEKQEVSIYNQLGQIVKRISINEETNQINISDFKTGIYYLRIGEKTEMFIKK